MKAAAVRTLSAARTLANATPAVAASFPGGCGRGGDASEDRAQRGPPLTVTRPFQAADGVRLGSSPGDPEHDRLVSTHDGPSSNRRKRSVSKPAAPIAPTVSRGQ